MNRVLLIVNPFAGGGEAQSALRLVKHKAASFTKSDFTYFQTSQPNDVLGIRNAIQQNRPEIVSILGGDGTINDVINVPEARNCLLHLLPGGSGNDFHRLLYGSVGIEHSLDILNDYRVKRVDVGTCNNRFFLNGVGIGFDGQVAMETTRMRLPLLPSKWKYWIAILKNVLFYPNQEITIEVDSIAESKKRFMVAIANGSDYGGGFKISPESDPTDGFLNLIDIREIGPLSRVMKIPMVEKGKHLEEGFVHQTLVKEVTVTCKKQLHAHVDGELMSGQHFEIKLQPQVSFVVSK